MKLYREMEKEYKHSYRIARAGWENRTTVLMLTNEEYEIGQTFIDELDIEWKVISKVR